MNSDDVTRLEAAVRDANPYPSLDAVSESGERAHMDALVQSGTADGSVPSVHGRKIMQTQQRPPLRRPHSNRPGWAIALATFVTVIVIGSVVLLVSPFSGDEPPVADLPLTTEAVTPTTVAPTTEGVTPTTVAPTTVSEKDGVVIDLPGGWYTVTADQLGIGGSTGSVTAFTSDADRIVAVGWVCQDSDPSTCAHVSWTSTDMVTWDMSEIGRAVHDDLLGVVGPIESVASTSFGFVATGTDVADDGSAGPAIWMSSDGLEWASTTQLPQPIPRVSAESIAEGTWAEVLLEVHRVVSFESSLFAVAGDLGPGFGVWRSDDGEIWSRVAGIPAVCDPETLMCLAGDGENPWVEGTEFFTDTEYMAWPTDLAVVGSNLVVFGGVCGGEEFDCYPGVWTSADRGSSWSRVVFDGFYGPRKSGGLPGYMIEAVGVSENRLIFFGTACDYGKEDCDSVTWMTTDGVDWTMNTLDPAMFGDEVFPDGLSVTAVAAHGDGFAAVAINAPVLWTSSDGVSWTTLDLVPGTQSSAIVAVDDVIVIGGSSESSNSSRSAEPAIWIHTPP